MGKPLHVLIVEDSEADLRTLLQVLEQSDYDASWTQAKTAAQLKAALEGQPWDLILSNYLVPKFGALPALAVLKDKGLDIPLIVVSESVGEEAAVAALKAGAQDFILKASKDRLISAIEEGIQAAQIRQQQRQDEAALRQSEAHFRQMAETIQDVFWITDFREPQILYVSPAYEEIWGRSRAEVYQDYTLWVQTIHPDDREKALAVASTCQQQDFVLNEYRIVRPDGSIRWIRDRGFAVRDSRGEVVQVMGVAQDITEAKKTEETLQESEARLRFVLSSSQIGEWDLDLTTQPHTAHRSLKHDQIFGYESPLPEWTYEIFLNHVHPQDRLAVDQKFQHTLATYTNWDFECRIIHPDQQVRWIWGTGSVYTDSNGTPIRLLGIVIDISDRKQTELALEQSELNFRTLADTVPQLFWTTQPDGYHDYFNRRWYEYTGMTLEQTQGWGWSHLLHPDDKQRCLELWNHCLRTGEEYNIEYRFQRASDHQYRWFLGQAIPLRSEDGQIIRWFGSCTEIHDQKQLEIERFQLLESEQAARTEAEAANRLKDEFLAVVSHELRSPLNAMLGWVQLLRQGKLNQTKTDQALQTIERNARTQKQLIEDILDVSRIITGKMRLNVYPVDLSTVITAAVETIRLAAEAKQIRLNLVLDSGAGLVAGDANRLQQVVWNLLSNAIKFTPKRGQVQVRLERVTSHLEIIVSDSGQGIPAELLPYVFDRFRQADSSSTRSYSGLGLGLAISRHLVELHGGSIVVDSPGEGEGTTFTVRLPLRAVRQQHQDQTQVNPTIETEVLFDCPIQLDGLQILVVDDQADACELLTTILEACGSKVITASSAQEALIQIKQCQPDILISDIGMPIEDGYMLLRQVRALEPNQGSQIPAVALTAYARSEDRRQALLAGFQSYLTKPVEPGELVAVIASLSGRLP